MTTLEIIEQYVREQRRRQRAQRQANFYADRTAKAKILQGRIEAAETILDLLGKGTHGKRIDQN